MKHYVMLIKEDPKIATDAGTMGKLEKDYIKWIDDLIASDNYIYGGRLLNERQTISVQGEVISDGPYVEPKEIIGGIVILKADNRGAALNLVKNSPIAGLLEIELREMHNA